MEKYQKGNSRKKWNENDKKKTALLRYLKGFYSFNLNFKDNVLLTYKENIRQT